MGANFKETLENSFANVFSRTGLVVLTAFSIIFLAAKVAKETLEPRPPEGVPTMPGTSLKEPLALYNLPAPDPIWNVVLIASAVACLVLIVGSLRNLAEKNLRKPKTDYFRENLAKPLFHLVSGFIVFAFLTIVRLLLTPLIIFSERKDFQESFSKSESLTENRTSVLALIFSGSVLSLAAIYLSIETLIILFDFGDLGNQLLQVLSLSFSTVFALNVVAETYNQLDQEKT